MSQLARIRLVLLRDVREQLNSSAFRITTAILVVAAMAAVALPSLLAGGPSTVTVGFVGDQSPVFREAVVAAAGQTGAGEVDSRTLDDRGQAETALAQGEVDVAVLGDDELLVADRGAVGDELATTVAGAAGLVTGLQQAGVDPATAAQGLASQPLTITAAEDSGATQERFWLVYAAMFVLYGALIAYGSAIVNGVVEEKSSRVVEVVVSTVRPLELLTGKVLAVGALAVGQLLVIGAPAMTLATITDQISLPSGSVGTFLAVIMWFVLGYAFYSTVFAAAGATANRTQDVQTVSMPVMFLLGLSLFGGIVALGAPDGLAAQILSYLPPTAPIAMLARSALGSAAIWQVALAVVIMVAATAATVKIAARIYRGSLLKTGQRVSLTRAWRGAES